jgi:Carboxypeptidase regulatory-like domain
VAGLEVRVLRYRYFEGRRQLVSVSGPLTQTDDLGRYRAYGLSPGDYFVSAASGLDGMSWDAQSESRSGFAPTYYPGTPSAADAQRVRVSVGSEVTANFAVLPARTLRVSGTATDAEGKPIANGVVMVQEGQGGRQARFTMSVGTMIKPDGTFSLNTLTPGEYVLHVTRRVGSTTRTTRPPPFPSCSPRTTSPASRS